MKPFCGPIKPHNALGLLALTPDPRMGAKWSEERFWLDLGLAEGAAASCVAGWSSLEPADWAQDVVYATELSD
jgi:hypothetical protein